MKNLILAFAFLFAMVACSDSADSTSSSAEHSQNESALNTDVLQWSYSQHSDDLSNWLDVTRCNVLRNDSLVLVQSSLAG